MWIRQAARFALGSPAAGLAPPVGAGLPFVAGCLSQRQPHRFVPRYSVCLCPGTSAALDIPAPRAQIVEVRKSPQRSCIGCRTVRDKRDLVRVVHTPEDRFALDPKGKVPGRGAYVCPDPACVQSAVKRKGFDRAFRQAVPRDAVEALQTAVTELMISRQTEAAESSES